MGWAIILPKAQENHLIFGRFPNVIGVQGMKISGTLSFQSFLGYIGWHCAIDGDQNVGETVYWKRSYNFS